MQFAPTILEHAAVLIGRTPSEVAQDAQLLADAHLAAYRRYRPAAVTVGMDIYNIEAEALGCTVRFYSDNSIPGIVERPATVGATAVAHKEQCAKLGRPDVKYSGRIGLLLEAAVAVKHEIASEVPVNIAICGPFSILTELLGYENAIDALCDEPEHTHALLAQILDFQKAYCTEIATLKLGAVVFESWASPPLITPAMYREFALPYEIELFAHMKALDFPARPLVIGGDTRGIVDDMLMSGTTILLSDYNAPLDLYVQKAREKGLPVRANIDPKLILTGDWQQITQRVQKIAAQAQEYPKLIVGSGVVPYDTPPENLLRVKEMINSIPLSRA